jgi:hypothetical protein
MEKTVAIQLDELREMIAQEIESIEMLDANALGVKYQAADIARGYGANHV